MTKKLLPALVVGTMLFASCTNMHKSMREPNTLVNLEKKDFTISDQFTGEASSTKILGIDWARLFKSQSANINKDGFAAALPIDIASIPVIGNFIADPTASYALYDCMEKNKGYDVAFYPQFETTINRPIGLGFIIKKTNVKVTTRLAKLNK